MIGTNVAAAAAELQKINRLTDLLEQVDMS
jgi:hypothetical protein